VLIAQMRNAKRMRKILLTALAVSVLSGPVFAGDVAVSIRVGQPGFYGQINIGDLLQVRRSV
jgi:hypothetical protein